MFDYLLHSSMGADSMKMPVTTRASLVQKDFGIKLHGGYYHHGARPTRAVHRQGEPLSGPRAECDGAFTSLKGDATAWAIAPHSKGCRRSALDEQVA